MAKPTNPVQLAVELMPHQNRVIQERLELADKVNKLEAFILSEKFAGVSTEEQALQQEQLEHMAMYLRVLEQRVALHVQAKRFICHKEVMARPMTRGDYHNLRGLDVPEAPRDEGYLVEYLDGGPTNQPGFAGYISWSPKVVFERGYKEMP